ncbi:MAG: class I SAM-dependent RNA methyltransferase [Acidobacteria bacterium]|nr:class I SAM-dependent RNA methyltransferase [Acidobacteriota bacterium]
MTVRETAEVTIEKLVHRGAGLGRLPDGKAVFVPYSVPGERLRVHVTEERASFARGVIEEILTSAPGRREPPCPYFGECGGCQLMHLEYARQLEWKQKILAEIWRHQQPADCGTSRHREFGYRQRIRLHVRPEADRLGFMHQNTKSIVNIEDCLLCHPAIRETFPWLRRQLLPKLLELALPVREILLAAGDDPPAAVWLQSSSPLDGRQLARLRRWSPYPLSGSGAGKDAPRVRLDIGGVCFEVSPDTFFQANSGAVAELWQHPALEVPPESRVLELYAGLGLFTLFLARRVREVCAVEGNPEARRLFDRNLALNPAAHVTFHQHSVERWLEEWRGDRPTVDTLFLDPPRTGLSRPVRQRLPELSFRRILYLSCDATTQHRDLQAWLNGGEYGLKSLTMFDFFPNTFHFECLARLYEHGS